MAGDAFQKIKDSASRTVTKISVKTSSSLEKQKIRMHIETLEKDVQKIYLNIGEETYALWAQGITSTETLAEKLEDIRQKKAEVERLTAQLDSIDERDNEILGTKTEAQASAEEGASSGPKCPNCGADCEASAKFCRKCGQKLQ